MLALNPPAVRRARADGTIADVGVRLVAARPGSVIGWTEPRPRSQSRPSAKPSASQTVCYAAEPPSSSTVLTLRWKRDY